MTFLRHELLIRSSLFIAPPQCSLTIFTLVSTKVNCNISCSKKIVADRVVGCSNHFSLKLSVWLQARRLFNIFAQITRTFFKIQSALMKASISVKVNFLLLEFCACCKIYGFHFLVRSQKMQTIYQRLALADLFPRSLVRAGNCFNRMLLINVTNQFIQHYMSFYFFAQCTCQPNSELAFIEPTLNVKIKLKKYLILHSLLYRKT